MFANTTSPTNTPGFTLSHLLIIFSLVGYLLLISRRKKDVRANMATITLFKIEEKHRCRKKHIFRGPCEHRHNFHLPFLGTTYLYICARCLGLYFGFFLFLFSLILVQPLMRIIQNLNSFELVLICFVLTLPLFFDWLSQSKGIRHSTNSIRLVSGLLTSLSGAIMIAGVQAIWITAPIGLLWFLTIGKIGHKWRKNRLSTFGCSACLGKLLEAKEVELCYV